MFLSGMTTFPIASLVAVRTLKSIISTRSVSCSVLTKVVKVVKVVLRDFTVGWCFVDN
jgi:hypothetical protein